MLPTQNALIKEGLARLPGSHFPVNLTAFSDELQKNAGMVGNALQQMKQLAMTNVGGPKGILQPLGAIGHNAATASKSMGSRMAQSAKSMRTANGAYDVSSMARQMGL